MTAVANSTDKYQAFMNRRYGHAIKVGEPVESQAMAWAQVHDYAIYLHPQSVEARRHFEGCCTVGRIIEIGTNYHGA
jgi:hypothetical protein